MKRGGQGIANPRYFRELADPILSFRSDFINFQPSVRRQALGTTEPIIEKSTADDVTSAIGPTGHFLKPPNSPDGPFMNPGPLEVQLCLAPYDGSFIPARIRKTALHRYCVAHEGGF